MVYWYRPHLKNVNCDSTDNCLGRPTGWDVSALIFSRPSYVVFNRLVKMRKEFTGLRLQFLFIDQADSSSSKTSCSSPP